LIHDLSSAPPQLQRPTTQKTPEIESIACVTSLSALPSPQTTSVSVITPPAVTLTVLKEAKSLGIPAIWLQPGCENAEVVELVRSWGEQANGMTVILGGPCVLVIGEQGLKGAKAASQL
jgi:hypothetical protein